MLIPFLLSTFNSVKYIESIIFIFMYVISLFFLILISNNSMFIKNTIYFIVLLSLILSAFTVLSMIFPNQLLSLVKPFMSEGGIRQYGHFVSSNRYPGISGQIGTNAFLIAIGFPFLLYRKKTIIIYIILGIMLISIFVSDKRGIILSLFISILVIYLIKIGLKNFKKLLVLIVASIPIIFLFILIIVKRISFDFNQISSGRGELYSLALEQFKYNPFLGIGINTFKQASGGLSENENTHNVYLQLLSEIGILGTSIYILTLLSMIIVSIKLLSKRQDNGLIKSSIFIQIFFIAYSFTGNPFYTFNFLIIYFIALSIIFNKWRNRNEKSRNYNFS